MLNNRKNFKDIRSNLVYNNKTIDGYLTKNGIVKTKSILTESTAPLIFRTPSQKFSIFKSGKKIEIFESHRPKFEFKINSKSNNFKFDHDNKS